jgi:hypothetical protein
MSSPTSDVCPVPYGHDRLTPTELAIVRAIVTAIVKELRAAPTAGSRPDQHRREEQAT